MSERQIFLARNGMNERLVASEPVDYLPPLEIPQPTEPMRIGQFWMEPAPEREPIREWPDLSARTAGAAIAIVLAAAALSALFPLGWT